MININKIVVYSLITNLILPFAVQAQSSVGTFRPLASEVSYLTASPTYSSVGTFRPNSIQGQIMSSKTPLISKEAQVDFDILRSGASLALNDKFSLEIAVGAFTKPSQIFLSAPVDDLELPWNQKKISEIYSYQVADNTALDKSKPMVVKIAYQAGNKQFKQVYLYNSVKKTWQALPTTDYPQDNLVKAIVKDSQAIVAVFAKPGTLTVGKASWYKYKGGDFAASPDFPKGSKLRVTNNANGKSVEVIVNDWGPERDKHPDRAIDLDKVAFAKIASTGDGIINVTVSPIQIAPDTNGRTLGVKADGLGNLPILVSKSVMVINDNDNEVWLDKNSNQTRPIASLTKVVAMSVYLSLQPDLDRELIYKTDDEKMNYRYCQPWESAKVNIKDNTKLSARDLFNSALVGSANNAVESLVRQSGLSRDSFIAKMNETAKQWGAVNTNFVEPSGLSNKNVSSAKDYALMIREAMKNEIIAKASVQASYVFTAGGVKHNLKNTNKLIVQQAQANLKAENYPIIASKTGFLNEAGYCLMTRVRQADQSFTIVSLGAPTREASFNEMADLINYLKFKVTSL